MAIHANRANPIVENPSSTCRSRNKPPSRARRSRGAGTREAPNPQYASALRRQFSPGTFANTIILGGEGRHQPNLTGSRAVWLRGDDIATLAFGVPKTASRLATTIPPLERDALRDEGFDGRRRDKVFG